MEKEKLLVRIELPFCTGHCVYCEKKTLGQNVGYLQRYRFALEKELKAAREELLEYEIVSSHVEADSPSLFGIGTWDDFLRRLKELIPGSPQWVVNLMPQELTPEMAHVLVKRQNIDRIQLCLDALRMGDLKRLHRPYTPNLVEHAFTYLQSPEGSLLRDRLGIELFYGIPGSSPEAFVEDLKRVLLLSPLQLSLRRFKDRTLPLKEQLTYSEETPWEDYLSGAKELLVRAGYTMQSRRGGMLSFALPGGLFTWNTPEASALPIMGFGLGAYTCFENISYHNTDDIALYLAHSDELEVIAVPEC